MQGLRNERRLEDLRRRIEQLECLCRLTADIARLGDERATLKKVVNMAASLIGVQGAHLALVDKDERALYGVISSGRHPEDAPRLKLQLSRSAAAQKALKSGRPVAIENAADDARVNSRARQIMAIRGVAYLPLLSGEESFGLLILITKRPHVWAPGELDLARRFADVASVALENSRLMTQLAETEVPDDAGSLVELSEEAVRNKGFVTSEYRLLDKSGEIRWFRDEAILVRDPSGRPIAWHGVLVEVTGMKKLQH